jgi:glycosyltransferase involved in cell wall biosynthesis
MRIVFITDTWEPDINGVVRTLRATKNELTRCGQDVSVIDPSLFRYIRCPLYPELRLSFGIKPRLFADALRPPCAIHIATEGPIGYSFSSYCARQKIPYSTAYHTNFPEYLRTYAWIPEGFSFTLLRGFHSTSSMLLVATHTLEEKLRRRGFRMPMALWSRGVDLDLFHPRPHGALDKPVALYVGRVALEKNVEAFLATSFDCHKWVVGDGPHLPYLRQKYPAARYLGYLSGEDLAAAFAQADVFVFPSRTDTFGLVMVEALASGVPVAAYPVEGPIDVIRTGQGVGHLSENLNEAIAIALRTGSSQACRNLAQQYTWRACTKQFLQNLVIHGDAGREEARPNLKVFAG